MNYEYLNACKSQSGLTNKAIALSKNISESTVSRFFHGEIKTPDIPLAKAICDAIGASLDQACGLVVPVDAAMTTPAPSIPAIVTDVVQAIPNAMNEEQIAEKVVNGLDPRVFAKALADILPKPQPMECESCRTARLYEASIARQSKLISALLGAVGAMLLLMIVLVIWLLTK